MAETNAPPELVLTADPDLDTRFAELAERHSRFMFKVAHGLLRNPHDAEDAVQEALLKLYRTSAWRHMDDERAFLARTVWRVALDITARRPEPVHEPASTELTSPANTPEKLTAEADERALLRELIHRLPDDLRQPLILCAVEEMTSREVAGALGLTEGAVRTRVMRARTELKRQFQLMQRYRTIRSQEKTQ
jgi:RNA polymerase sigma-70 factor (ECF subfamily)